jgi:hypothetical protein
VRSAPRDKLGDTGDVVLERTTGQTLWWFLGHRATVGTIGVMLGSWVIILSAVASGPAPATTTGPGQATEAATTTAPTDVTITLTCTPGTQLTLTANGVGDLQLTVNGPTTTRTTGSERVTASLTGPAGTYSARFTSTGRIDTVSWASTAGKCCG